MGMDCKLNQRKLLKEANSFVEGEKEHFKMNNVVFICMDLSLKIFCKTRNLENFHQLMCCDDLVLRIAFK